MKKINDLHELSVEKQRLQQKLALLKRELELEVQEIKQQFSPVTKIMHLLGGGNSSHNGSESTSGNLLKMGAMAGVDLLIGQKLRKAGMLTKLIVPPLLRGISSGAISLFNRFRKKK